MESKAAWISRTARSTSGARTTQEIRIDEVEIISMLMPASARVWNIFAATPGCERMPAPTSDTFPISGSAVHPSAPISAAMRSSTCSERDRSSFGRVKVWSVRPSSDTFCTIMSTLMASPASAPNTLAATPGRSGTRRIRIIASDVSWTTPETIAFSIRSSPSWTYVPGSPWNDERTCSTTL